MSNFSEDPKERADKYIANLSKTIQNTAVSGDDKLVLAANVCRVTDAIERYLHDAEHYLSQGRPTTSLASIAYAEGLLDALTFLELARLKDSQ